MTEKLSAEIEIEIEKNASAERESVRLAAGMTAEQIENETASYWNLIHTGSKEYNAIADETEKAKYIEARIVELARVAVHYSGIAFVKWAREYDAQFPGTGDALIAAFLLTTGTASLTFKRDGARSIIWQAQENAKKAEHAERAKIAEAKLTARIAKLNSQGLKLCGRCGGAGGWKGWPGFTCFDCNGSGAVPMTDREKRDYAKSIVAVAEKK